MPKLLKDILHEQMQIKGVTLERLRRETGIAERYLTALIEGDAEKLPAAPYVHGYLSKVAPLLDLSSNELWEIYRNEGIMKSSGPADKMPENRFALRRFNKKLFFAGIIGALLVSYLIFGADRYLGRPELTVLEPSEETTVTAVPVINVSGIINPRDSVMVGGETIAANPDGTFEIAYSLESGMNTIVVKAINPITGRATEIIRQVIYQTSEL